MGIVLLILFYILFPAVVLYLADRYTIVQRIGPVVICYAFGVIVGNIFIFGENVDKCQEPIQAVSILLAIPLILFSLDVKSWLKIARKTFLSLILAIVSILVMIFLGYFIFKNEIREIWNISGMLVGCYSGGTPNMASIKMALNVDADTFIVTNTYDLMVGAVVLLFLVTIAQRTFLLFMRPFRAEDMEMTDGQSVEAIRSEFESYDGIFKARTFKPLLAAISIAVFIIGLSYLISLGVEFLGSKLSAGNSQAKDSEILMSVIIICITTLGIIFSLIKKINRIKKTFQVGMYLILIFCIVVASMADIRSFNLSSWPILVYIVIAVVGSLFLHGILSWIFNVDVDNFLVISTGLTMSPPFVPVIAGALRNKLIIIPGLVVGIIGYAIGNYLGILVAGILK
ncbi:MAG: DUF819 family protein [Bacteroidales bacterium]|nr:DUF819 family protein [Bacteroidales bacterium]